MSLKNRDFNKNKNKAIRAGEKSSLATITLVTQKTKKRSNVITRCTAIIPHGKCQAGDIYSDLAKRLNPKFQARDVNNVSGNKKGVKIKKTELIFMRE